MKIQSRRNRSGFWIQGDTTELIAFVRYYEFVAGTSFWPSFTTQEVIDSVRRDIFVDIWENKLYLNKKTVKIAKEFKSIYEEIKQS